MIKECLVVNVVGSHSSCGGGAFEIGRKEAVNTLVGFEIPRFYSE